MFKIKFYKDNEVVIIDGSNITIPIFEKYLQAGYKYEYLHY